MLFIYHLSNIIKWLYFWFDFRCQGRNPSIWFTFWEINWPLECNAILPKIFDNYQKYRLLVRIYCKYLGSCNFKKNIYLGPFYLERWLINVSLGLYFQGWKLGRELDFFFKFGGHFCVYEPTYFQKYNRQVQPLITIKFQIFPLNHVSVSWNSVHFAWIH